MGRKRKIIRIAIGIGCGVGLVWGLSVLTRSGSSRYDEFLRAKRIADFAVRCQNSSLGRLFPQSFRHRFVERFREKAQSQRISLYRSNSLSWFKVYAPESPERNRQLREVQLKAINSHWFLEIDTADEDTI